MNVAVAGAGMIVHDQLLPSFYQLQRDGTIGEISVCARRPEGLRALAESPVLGRVFPAQTFSPFSGVPEMLAALQPRNLVAVAVPDHLHYEVIRAALAADQHVLSVKPLVLKAAQAGEIEREARRRGLFVGIDYHKRFDVRSLIARRDYRRGRFGEFRLGSARLIEKWSYRRSNFQNWCTTENSDAFTYIGCHYVDLVAFITGLLPVGVSVCGIEERFPNGRAGYLWTDARIRWSNGACLNVQNGLGYPDAAPGANAQGMTLYCAGAEDGGLIDHSDQYRGVKWCYPEERAHREPNPDYFDYAPEPSGYGYRSLKALVQAALEVEAGASLDAIDAAGLLATPANSRYNEQVIEAGRLSIQEGGREVLVNP